MAGLQILINESVVVLSLEINLAMTRIFSEISFIDFLLLVHANILISHIFLIMYRGTVVQLEPNRFLTVNIKVDPPTPTFGRFVAQKFRDKYYPLYVATKMLNISPRVLAKITASVFFEPGTPISLCNEIDL